MLSVHGLIRGQRLELGRDADTGGQTKYVVDLARALAAHPDVDQVDLVTRRLTDSSISQDYARQLEPLCDGARIVRIDCGPEEYIAKEQLWDHLDSFTDNLVEFLNQQDRRPDFVHSHYADAGYVGVRLSNLLAVPLIHTGHSLGRDKRKRLLARGVSRDHIENTYHMERRIDAEEETLANAEMVVNSTHQEIEEQYSLYNYYDPERMVVIPPGTDIDHFRPYEPEEKIEFKSQVDRFLCEPDKPLILALSRPDERKNITTLMEAYGESAKLQDVANLLIVAGNRDDIRDMDEGAQNTFMNILVTVDTYNLYGKVALPKNHAPEDVPAIYRMAAASGGVFVNPALTEPFGLTLLEAAASGLPLVATENGGPVDIIRNCQCGELVDPLDKEQISDAILGFIADTARWKKASQNGIARVRENYSWSAHAKAYVDSLRQLPTERGIQVPTQPVPGALRYRDRMLVTDLDQNLLGDEAALRELVELVRSRRKQVTFVIATGRQIDSALAVMKKHGIPRPDILISGLGTRIHYGQQLVEDEVWADHIDHHWSPRRVAQFLSHIPGLSLQARKEQSPTKLSYFWNPNEAPSVDEINTILRQHELTTNIVTSFGQFLDALPSRASKGQALRFVAQQLDISLDKILVAGGSGADEDMMRGNTLAVVVANRHHEEVSLLQDVNRIYFAERHFAAGILEAIEYYDFFGRCSEPEQAAPKS
ncbi:HAD-IIB family hydrolase [Seongchinamella unica]|uniref:sucrose-phosphate synthase n=1 Tax=Seongchinamella unica TaxID=2547392 RepID=A0A4R5LSU3_9GAMM|nr:HAD-IIB family hydrolase [Seongchinamella unica]TDG13988.1 HAD-IIB family hydrolase [Seongchinamella unica]